MNEKWVAQCPPGFENSFNGTNLHYHFYVKTNDPFFMYNILYITGVIVGKHGRLAISTVVLYSVDSM